MKLKKAFQYEFLEGIRVMGWTALWAVVALIFVPIIVTALTGRMNTLSPEDFLPNGFLGFALMIFLLIFSAATYDSFQFLIQNGVGRKTYFYSKTLTIISISIIGNIARLLYNWGALPFNKTRNGFEISSFDALYQHYFSGAFFNNMMLFILLVVFTICIAATLMFSGSILSLFDRRVQIILIIGIPIMLILALLIILRVDTGWGWQLTWIGKAIYWIVGVPAEYTPADIGHWNLWHPLISGVIYSLVLFGGTYFFNLKLKTPR